MKIRILCWQRIPYAADEQPGMPTYRIAGMVKPGTINREFLFLGDFSAEIDGNECEYKHIDGHVAMMRANDDPDVWEALLLAVAENESLTAEMQAEATRYYA